MSDINELLKQALASVIGCRKCDNTMEADT
jgi:hypothetical protein